MRGHSLDDMLLLTSSTLGRLNSADQSIAGMARDLTYVVRGARNTAAAAAGLYLVQKAFRAVFSAGESLDQMLIRSQIHLGSYGNALEAYRKFQNGVISGDLLGNASDYLAATKLLAVKGIQMTDAITKNLNNMAAASGNTITQVASDINAAIAGNQHALESYGISAMTMHKYNKMYEGDTIMMRSAVMSLLKSNRQMDGALKDMPLTWERISNRMAGMKDKFFEAIAGNSKDPNSLSSMVKRTFWNTLDFLYKNAATFKAIAGTISAFLKFTFNSIADFAKFVYNATLGTTTNIGKFLANWKENTAGMILYLGVIQERVRRFYVEHEQSIKTLLKLFAAYKIGSAVLGILPVPKLNATGLTLDIPVAFNLPSIAVFLRSLNPFAGAAFNFTRSSGVLGNAFISGFQTVLNVVRGLFGSPLSFLLVGISALLVIVGTESEAVRNAMGGWYTTLRNILGVIGMVAIFTNPVVGVIALIAYHWTNVKTTVVNVFYFFREIGLTLISMSKAIYRFLYTFKPLRPALDGIKTLFHGILWLINQLPKAIEWVWTKVNNLLSTFTGWFSSIREWLDSTNNSTVTGTFLNKVGASSETGVMKDVFQYSDNSLGASKFDGNIWDGAAGTFNANVAKALLGVTGKSDRSELDDFATLHLDKMVEKLQELRTTSNNLTFEIKIPDGFKDRPEYAAEYLYEVTKALVEKHGANPSVFYQK